MNKLYLVKTIGLGSAYVCAKDAESAYLAYRDHLDEKKLGFEKDRALDSITLSAEAHKDYPECGTKLLFKS